jgi:hypothetical protein
VRTYKATISGDAGQREFPVVLGEAEFFSTFYKGSIRTAGDVATISMWESVEPNNSSNPGVVERLRGQGHLSIEAGATGTFGESGFTVPLDGVLEYCPGDVALSGPYVSCQAGGAVTCYSFPGAYHELTLRRR